MEKERCDVDVQCDTCDGSGKCKKEDQEKRRLERRLCQIRHKILVMSGKGGVGKSTVATNLGAAMALRGYRVGILDADLHGPNVARMLGVEGQSLAASGDSVEPIQVSKNFKAVSMALLGYDPDQAIIWRGPLKHTAIKQFIGDVNWGDLDFLFIDLPPGTGDEALSVANILRQVDGAVIVTTPQDVALLDARKAVSFSRLLNVPVLGIVENMSGMACPHCGGKIELFKVGGGEKAAAELGVPFLGRIPIDPHIVELCDSGKPFVAEGIDSEAKTAFVALTQKLLDAVTPSGETPTVVH
ncbi:MAG TPA: Mrp/NBP35 family ATP-binding protein [Syntrophobacteria bacterium]|nr:Mrp/NBP35 family ATP-binding protein [Syntrophobacteria bacterium]